MESSASAGRVTSAVLDPRRWRALALLCAAFFMVLLDGTITIVALPSIAAGLRFSEQGLQGVLSAYALTFGGLLLLGGRAATCSGAGTCSWPAPCWPGSAWRWRSCSPADRGSQRTSCQSRTRRPMPLPQETW